MRLRFGMFVGFVFSVVEMNKSELTDLQQHICSHHMLSPADARRNGAQSTPVLMTSGPVDGTRNAAERRG